MSSQKPSIPKGTRDFSPLEMSRRNYIFETITSVFRTCGFQQIETPAMENLSTLLGKYGEEGDKLLFRILNSGDFLKGVPASILQAEDSGAVGQEISKRGLRYDLTVPFARYVVQHRNEITFPFKRYQVQPVWRADNPQMGRYREFYQCDADMIGTASLLNEHELLHIIDKIFARLELSVTIKINNRKILAGISEVIGEEDKIVPITIAIDKLDKIGIDKVNQELLDRGVKETALKKLAPVFEMQGSNEDKISFLSTYLSSSEIGMKGIEELKMLYHYLSVDPVNAAVVELDITLARGLNYYTGAIIEVKSNEVNIGSICGGGRYDDLTGIFGLPDVSGVGISFGADRIYDVLHQLNRFPDSTQAGTQVLFVNFGDEEADYILPFLSQLRKDGIVSEIYPEASKLKKQMNYADQSGIPYVILAGENEMKDRMFTLKDMKSGDQRLISFEELLEIVRS